MENNFTKTIKDFLIDKLEEFKGQNENVYIGDLGNLLTEGINMDGSIHYSTYKSKEFIKENFEEFRELLEYLKISLDMELNPFNEPEKAEVIAYNEGVEYLLNQLKTIEELEERENGKITLTDELIDKIIEELEKNKYEIEF